MHSNSTPLPLWNYPLELLQNSYWMVTSFPHPFHYHHSFTTTNHYESRSSYSIQAKASSHLYTSRNYCTNSHNWGHRKESVPFALRPICTTEYSPDWTVPNVLVLQFYDSLLISVCLVATGTHLHSITVEALLEQSQIAPLTEWYCLSNASSFLYPSSSFFWSPISLWL